VHPELHEEELLGRVVDRELILRLWPYLRPHRALLGASFALIPLRSVFELLPGPLIAVGLNALIEGRESALELRGLARLADVEWFSALVTPPGALDLLAWLAILLLVVLVAGSVVEWARMLAMAVMGQRAMFGLRERLFHHVQRLPMRFFDRYPVGRLVTRLTNDIETVAEMFTGGLVALVADLFGMVVFGAILFVLHPELAAVAMIVVPVLTAAAVVLRWKAREVFRDVRVKIARINAHLQETITGMRVVQLFAREGRNFGDFSRLNASHRDAWFRYIGFDASLSASVELAQNLTIAAILWYGAGLIGAGEIAYGLLFWFVDWMRRFFQPIQDLSARYSVMQSSMASCERIFQLLDTTAEAPDPERARPLAPGAGIEFDAVTFGYGGEPVLHDVSFRVAPGERVALVGPTGSGKTTILKLLARLYEIDRGAIRVGGVDVREIPRAELRRRIAFVLQDVFLFTGDLRHNIGLGRPDVSEADVAEAARTVHADRFVERLPEGWNQQVRERGVNFSAGERQLLSFARALSQRPEFLLLDEATANVDTETEALIQDGVHRLMEGKTSIVVAHRLSTIQDVDRILVLHHGELREEGTHEELLARRGLYWRLYQLQYAAQEAA
jgi:ABC-type multidrug transport system fused ATPase/permease subunit